MPKCKKGKTKCPLPDKCVTVGLTWLSRVILGESRLPPCKGGWYFTDDRNPL